MKKKLNIWIVLITIVNMVLVILNTNLRSRIFDVFGGIIIGMQIDLLIDALLKNRKEKINKDKNKEWDITV